VSSPLNGVVAGFLGRTRTLTSEILIKEVYPKPRTFFAVILTLMLEP